MVSWVPSAAVTRTSYLRLGLARLVVFDDSSLDARREVGEETRLPVLVGVKPVADDAASGLAGLTVAQC